MKSCEICQENGKAVAPLHPWEWPARPWSRLHVDFAVVDAHSKWLEVVVVLSPPSQQAITALRNIFLPMVYQKCWSRTMALASQAEKYMYLACEKCSLSPII